MNINEWVVILLPVAMVLMIILILWTSASGRREHYHRQEQEQWEKNELRRLQLEYYRRELENGTSRTD